MNVSIIDPQSPPYDNFNVGIIVSQTQFCLPEHKTV